MEYNFTDRKTEMGRAVFALTLDRKKLTERIVIGRADEVRRQLETGGGEVYFDESRPLGSLLIGFESDPVRQWDINALTLQESYGLNLTEPDQRKVDLPMVAFLQEKYESSEPSAKFAAIKTWDEYLNCSALDGGGNILLQRLAMLYRPFFLHESNRLWQEEPAAALLKTMQEEDSAVRLWYPAGKRPFEWVVASDSFLPLIAYYLHKIEEWGFVFLVCKVCGKDFLARSRHYELCSGECRKIQAVEAKREFDERVKGDQLEQLDEAAYYYWYNRQRKLKRGKTADPEKAVAVGVAFKAFRKEAVKRKGMVKRGDMSLAEFSAWLEERQNEIDRLVNAEDSALEM